jgi:hypothetical protein
VGIRVEKNRGDADIPSEMNNQWQSQGREVYVFVIATSEDINSMVHLRNVLALGLEAHGMLLDLR